MATHSVKAIRRPGGETIEVELSTDSVLPAQWIVDETTGSLILDVTTGGPGLDDIPVLVARIDGSESTFKVWLSPSGTPMVFLGDVDIRRIWYEESSDTHPTIQLLGQGQIRMRDLPTSDPLVSGQLWNDSGVMKISA